MSYPPAKRQRSNTSRESANGTPQTAAPALRHHQVNPGLSLYSPTGYENGGYSLQPTARQAVAYNPYSPGPVTNPAGGYAGTYQNSSAAYSAGPYSPQQQANSFAAHYPQAAPTHYTQAGVNGIRNGNFAETQAQTQTQTLLQSQSPQPGTGGTYSPVPPNHHVTSYQHQQPRTNPPTSTLSQHPQHPLSQYGEPYTTQPAAHATSYHTNANSYPDPSTLNSHFSPAHLPSPAHLHSPALSTPLHQNGNSLTPEDMQDDDDDEDALGEAADESTEVYTNPDLSKTSIPSIPSVPTPPVDTSSRGSQRFKKCSCKTGRGDKKACVFCVCSKQGLSCNPTCSCSDACANPFTDLTQFFGAPPAFPKPCGANACFATWLCNQPNVEELDMDLIIDILLYDDTSWATIQKNNKLFREWEESWKRTRGGSKRKKNREERERLEFELLRGALGNCNQNDFYGHWYSFCQGGWVPTDAWYHCQECRLCKPSQEWHCDKHNRCTTGGICPECASAVPYANMMAYPDPGS